VNWIVALVAIVTAADLPQRVRQLREYPAVERATIGVGVVAVAVGIVAAASPLLDALDVSAPTLEVGAGMVLILWSVVAFFGWTDDPAPPAVAGGLVPGLFPIALTPAFGVVLWAVGARSGLPVPLVGSAIVAAAVLTAPSVERAIGCRPARRVSASVGVVVGIVLMTEGVLAV
jgi:hypothetical protein